ETVTLRFQRVTATHLGLEIKIPIKKRKLNLLNSQKPPCDDGGITPLVRGSFSPFLHPGSIGSLLDCPGASPAPKSLAFLLRDLLLMPRVGDGFSEGRLGR